MPRHDDWQDDDRDVPPRRSNSSTWIIVLVVVGVLALIPCLAIVGMALLWSTAESDRSRPAAVEEAKKIDKKAVYTREEFETAFVGRMGHEVVEVLGQPASKDAILGDQCWRYRGVTIDPETGRPDASTTLWFGDDGKVTRVSY
jgi:hypothetical protein